MQFDSKILRCGRRRNFGGRNWRSQNQTSITSFKHRNGTTRCVFVQRNCQRKYFVRKTRCDRTRNNRCIKSSGSVRFYNELGKWIWHLCWRTWSNAIWWSKTKNFNCESFLEKSTDFDIRRSDFSAW